ncbi:MAG: TetR/AcrR family transcriptional regulator [Rubellimicrobium sp.]|nr:TetR/AcrR family transcriptional regulator [Rubellimicrobium sp.]
MNLTDSAPDTLDEAGPDAAPEIRPADPRCGEILDQARTAFVEKGFDGASMQDLARAAGMSAGNFYRYFASKSAIVEALVTRDLDEIEQKFHLVVSADDPLAALRTGLRERMEAGCLVEHALWTEIIAAAGRKPEIAEALARMETQICDRLLRVFAHAAALPLPEAERRFAPHARFLLMLVRDMTPFAPESRQMRSDLTRLFERTIDMVMDEITQTNPQVQQ